MLCRGLPPAGASEPLGCGLESMLTFWVDQRHPTFAKRWVPLIVVALPYRNVTAAE